MPHVSPVPVSHSLSDKIYRFLIGAITSKRVSEKQRRDAFDELLTRTEKIMLGKRLTAVSLLSQGTSSYRVGKVLQLSTTTVAKLDVRVKSGGLDNTKKVCETLRKGPLQSYLENLVKPLPRYGTSPASLFKEK